MLRNDEFVHNKRKCQLLFPERIGLKDDYHDYHDFMTKAGYTNYTFYEKPYQNMMDEETVMHFFIANLLSCWNYTVVVDMLITP